ncbi:MAG: ABC transporter permease subunit [Treponema sp.]|jgi:putative aldouronate transport system permease protein|nr:ABC transporter permease subunit [Treponema sp.]
MTQLNKMNKKRGIRLFFMLSPFMVLTFLLSYLPLWGWVYAFFNYKPGLPIGSHNFAGWENFRILAQDQYAVKDILRVLRNTFAMSLIGMATSWLPMAFAILLNEIKHLRYRKVVQTLTTIPNFISWVLVFSVAYSMFSVDDGFVNRLLVSLGLISEGIPFMSSQKHVWLTMWLWGTWKGLGWSAIMYIASLMSIDQELYEAARVDGAGRFACIWHITIPGLLPTYFVLLILSIASFLNSGMEQYLIFQNPMNKSWIEVLDLYIYNQGIAGINYSHSVAVGMLKSLVSITLLLLANRGSKFLREESIF